MTSFVSYPAFVERKEDALATTRQDDHSCGGINHCLSCGNRDGGGGWSCGGGGGCGSRGILKKKKVLQSNK